MSEPFSSNLGIKLRFASWPTALIGIVVIKAVLSLAVKPGSFLVSYSGISYFLLLLLATGFAIRNGIRQTLGSRPFWVFLAITYGLWALNQGLKLYYELALGIWTRQIIRSLIRFCSCTSYLSWQPWQPSRTGMYPIASHTGRS